MRCACSSSACGRDDILITQLPNIAEYPALYLAALRLGIIVSPVPMQFRRHELEQIVDLTGARAILDDASDEGHGLRGERRWSCSRAARCRCCVSATMRLRAARHSLPPSLTDASRRRLREHVVTRRVSADDIATICWTSGTEGMPKGVPRTHNHWISISYGHLHGAGIQRGERLLNPFPLINMAAIGGCFMSWLHSARHARAAPPARPRRLPAADRRGKSRTTRSRRPRS